MKSFLCYRTKLLPGQVLRKVKQPKIELSKIVQVSAIFNRYCKYKQSLQNYAIFIISQQDFQMLNL